VDELRTPTVADWPELARVHTERLLGDLDSPAFLARVFGVDPAEVLAGELVRTVRLATGATVAAARLAVAEGRPTLNLLGGFHHAGPDSAGGNCVVNDLAVAVAALRADGFRGRVVILDLDAHPPDGTAACFAGDPDVWIASLSGADWVALPGVDETVLAPGTGDAGYLEALDAMLARRPVAELALVIAGGDVLAGDRFGRLALTLEGALERDARVLAALGRTPSVWLPGGGYHRDAWRVLAGTAMLLATGHRQKVPSAEDPLHLQWADIAARLDPRQLAGDGPWLTQADLDGELVGRPAEPRLLGHYTTEGIAYALYRYGLVDHLRRLGYDPPRVELEPGAVGDRMRIFAAADGEEHLLSESVLSRAVVDDRPVLFVHWLTLRNPRTPFSDALPRQPGQDVPGLGLAREAGEMFARIAERLGLQGISLRPAHVYSAWASHPAFEFVDPDRHARWLALRRDAGARGPAEIDAALVSGSVRLDGVPYAWEPEPMVTWLDGHRHDPERIRPRVDALRFTFGADAD
jgi:acetoin utilization deacetylase AcuC-like enzyme